MEIASWRHVKMRNRGIFIIKAGLAARTGNIKLRLFAPHFARHLFTLLYVPWHTIYCIIVRTACLILLTIWYHTRYWRCKPACLRPMANINSIRRASSLSMTPAIYCTNHSRKLIWMREMRHCCRKRSLIQIAGLGRRSADKEMGISQPSQACRSRRLISHIETSFSLFSFSVIFRNCLSCLPFLALLVLPPFHDHCCWLSTTHLHWHIASFLIKFSHTHPQIP